MFHSKFVTCLYKNSSCILGRWLTPPTFSPNFPCPWFNEDIVKKNDQYKSQVKKISYKIKDADRDKNFHLISTSFVERHDIYKRRRRIICAPFRLISNTQLESLETSNFLKTCSCPDTNTNHVLLLYPAPL